MAAHHDSFSIQIIVFDLHIVLGLSIAQNHVAKIFLVIENL